MSIRTVLLACLCASVAYAADPQPKEFEALKKLVGQWEGKAKAGPQEFPVSVSYELTSGGTAVLERSFAGTPHEMVSIYTVEGSKVGMTHYCAAGNHPRMGLKKADAKSLEFELIGSEGLIKGADEMHMHGVRLSFLDANRLKQDWTSYEGGVQKDIKTLELTRKK